MKKLIAFLVIILAASNVQAQQDPMLTQYMFNGFFLNPAYAGSHDYWTSTVSYRSQWTGADFEGAPRTAIVAVDGPIRGKNTGLGFIMTNDRLGVTNTTSFMGSYAYHLKLNKKQKLSFGINAGVMQYSANLNDVLIWDEEDEVYANRLNKLLPRIGTGIYYYSDRHYVGVSIPTLLAYEDGSEFSVDISKASFLRRHYLLTAGVIFDVSEKVKFKPSILMKYVNNAPLEADINFSTIFDDKFWVGASYRSGDAVALIFEYQSNNFFRIGYSYDITFSGLRNYQNGSHEIMIGVDFGKDLAKIKSPRYF